LELLQNVFKGVDLVFHEAAIASMPISIEDPIMTHDVNLSGTLNVFMAAKDNNIKRVVYASSAAVYGEPDKTPQIETDNLNPLSPYAFHKLGNESYAQIFSDLYEIEIVGLRYFNVYGERQDPSSPYSGVISKFIDLMKAQQQIIVFGDGEQTRDFVYIKDVVAANLLAAEKENLGGEVFNVGTASKTTILDLFTVLAEYLDYELKPDFAPERPGDIKHSRSSIEKAQELLGFNPAYDLKTGLKEITIGT
ncbi:NAD-dependent epimerase/dehydratase family protein, partial [Candidatus Peregrinibacteria bacterium]|nr:NAD-dependent epimerase/dehydratase family protein [Candidatus Peregrinibacteria bacterium]